ncbi:MAG: hypothetical protein ACK47B_09120 [Armatimonadota bacterium]
MAGWVEDDYLYDEDEYDPEADAEPTDEEWFGPSVLIVRNWHNLACVDLARIKDLSAEAMEATCDQWRWEMMRSAGFDVREPTPPLPIGGGLWTAKVQVHENPFKHPTWPIPLRGSALAVEMVLREWVEDEPDPRLAEAFAAEWRQALEHARCSIPSWDTLTVLAQLGLPATPGTLYHLYSRTQPGLVEHHLGSRPGPTGLTRGVCVTTFCLASGVYPFVETARSAAVHQIEASHSWATKGLHADAIRVAEKHAEWWKRRSSAELPKVTKRRGRKIGDEGKTALRVLRGEIAFDDGTETLRQIFRDRGETPPDTPTLRRRLSALVDHYRKKK